MIRGRAAAGWVAVLVGTVGATPGGAAAQAQQPSADTVGLVGQSPMAPARVPIGPLPPGTRISFTRDSLLWTGALTLSDLLTEIPGVYVARSGFLGQPEVINYAGRGPAALEIFWDGFPMDPMGDDSVYVDPGQIHLSYLRRIDVEILPASLRVYLVSERHEEAVPRTMIRVTSGAFGTAQYTGLFQKRWPGGVGLNLAGDFTGSDGEPQSGRSDRTLEIWGRLAWLPTARSGATYQIRRQDQDRDGFGTGSAGAPPARFGIRTDQMFQLFTSTRDHGQGVGVSLGLGSSSWSDSTRTLQEVRQGYASLRYAVPNLTGEVTGRVGDARFRTGAAARVGWVPVTGIVLSAEGGVTDYDGDRRARFAGTSGGVQAGPFSLTGSIMYRHAVQAPSLLTDSVQVTTDAMVSFGIDWPFFSGHVRYAERDAFQPLASSDYPGLIAFDSSRATGYLIADLALRPGGPWRINAQYSDPRDAVADLQPPKHGRVDLTFRSKFWRTFRSGAFDLMVRYGIESWSTGTAGLDENTQPIPLPGATFHEAFLQIQLVDFAIFWNLRNARNSQATYVPDRTYPRNAQTFGVRWVFAQ